MISESRRRRFREHFQSRMAINDERSQLAVVSLQTDAVQPELAVLAVSVPATALLGRYRQHCPNDHVRPVALAAVDLLGDAKSLPGFDSLFSHHGCPVCVAATRVP
jgi:hypothetical protein